MTEQTNTTGKADDKGIVAQAQERVTGAAAGAVDTIKANPKTAAAIAVGAVAAVAGVVYREKITDAVTSATAKTDTKGNKTGNA